MSNQRIPFSLLWFLGGLTLAFELVLPVVPVVVFFWYGFEPAVVVAFSVVIFYLIGQR